MFQKSHIFIMMIFHARTKLYTSVMGKVALIVILCFADRTLEILTEYWFQCGRPRGILFPSSWTWDYLTKDSVIQFFRESAKRAGIQKHVSTHCLRHSFASHLFESGCDVKIYSRLLGHRDPKSTEVYLHVSNKTLLGIRSPFDEMGGE